MTLQSFAGITFAYKKTAVNSSTMVVIRLMKVYMINITNWERLHLETLYVLNQ